MDNNDKYIGQLLDDRYEIQSVIMAMKDQIDP